MATHCSTYILSIHWLSDHVETGIFQIDKTNTTTEPDLVSIFNAVYHEHCGFEHLTVCHLNPQGDFTANASIIDP